MLISPFISLILLTAKVISMSLSVPELPLYGWVGLMLINLEGVGYGSGTLH